LILRALLSGNVRLFEEALSDLSGMPVERASGLVHASRSGGFEALYRKAGLPLRACRPSAPLSMRCTRRGSATAPPAMRGCRGA